MFRTLTATAISLTLTGFGCAEPDPPEELPPVEALGPVSYDLIQAKAQWVPKVEAELASLRRQLDAFDPKKMPLQYHTALADMYEEVWAVEQAMAGVEWWTEDEWREIQLETAQTLNDVEQDLKDLRALTGRRPQG